MEKKFALFLMRTNDNYPIWDIIRYKVDSFLRKSENEQSLSSHAKKDISKSIKLFKGFIISISCLIKPLNSCLFFISSRNKDDNSIFFDLNADGALSALNKADVSIIETYTPYGNYKYSDYNIVLHSFIHTIKKLKYKNFKLDTEVLNEILNAIGKSFPSANLSKLSSVLNDEYSSFISSFLFYNWLFNKNKYRLKRIFVTQNGIQKGLFLAAKKNNILTYEFQHGSIDRTHPAYSYNSDIKYNKGDIINPNFLLTLSDYWPNLFYHPFIKNISIGNDYFNKKTKARQKTHLTVITSNVHDMELRPVTKNIAQENPAQKIYYKLHPNQFHQFNEIEEYFLENKNVSVLTNEKNVSQLVIESKALLAVVSTAVYEALHNNTIVIILKKLNYQAHEDIFNNPNVQLIEDFEGFSSIWQNDLSFVEDEYYTFFKAFNEELFKKIVSF
ncbi:hypothetical protein K5G00_27645 [Maribellus maritimus]|nr:hypothetical protein [Maribellus maritimus]